MAPLRVGYQLGFLDENPAKPRTPSVKHNHKRSQSRRYRANAHIYTYAYAHPETTYRRRSRRRVHRLNTAKHSSPFPPSCRTAVLFCIRTSVRIYTDLVQIHLTNTSRRFARYDLLTLPFSDALLSTLARSCIPSHSVRSLNSRLVIDVAGRLLLDEKTRQVSFFKTLKFENYTLKIIRFVSNIAIRTYMYNSSTFTFSRMTN